MATSKTGLVNQALVKLGQSTITNLDTDTSTLANTARTIYDTVRRAVIMAHPWNSVIKRVKLARLSDAPAFGFSYQYQLPTDFIAIYKPEDIRDDYRIELSADSTSRVIVTDCTEFNITYKAETSEVTNTDTNVVAALVNAEIDTYVGFKFHRTQLLTLNTTTDVRTCFAYVESGIQVGVGEERMNVDPTRSDKRFNPYMLAEIDLGGTRMEEVKVVEISCDESP